MLFFFNYHYYDFLGAHTLSLFRFSRALQITSCLQKRSTWGHSMILWRATLIQPEGTTLDAHHTTRAHLHFSDHWNLSPSAHSLPSLSSVCPFPLVWRLLMRIKKKIALAIFQKLPTLHNFLNFWYKVLIFMLDLLESELMCKVFYQIKNSLSYPKHLAHLTVHTVNMTRVIILIIPQLCAWDHITLFLLWLVLADHQEQNSGSHISWHYQLSTKHQETWKCCTHLLFF